MNLISALQSRFSPAQIGWVCAAWQEFPSLWNALEEETLQRRALEMQKEAPRGLTPAFLGLLALEYPRAPQDLKQPPFERFADPTWEGRALKALEALRSGLPPQEPPLAHAALVALALRARFLRALSWDFLAPLLAETSPPAWGLPLAVLSGLLPDASDFYLRLLLLPEAPDTAWRVYLAQPLPPEEQTASLVSLPERLPLTLLPAALGALQARRPALAGSLRAAWRTRWPQVQTALQESGHRAWQLFPAEVSPPAGNVSPAVAALTALTWLDADAPERAAASLPPESEHPAVLSALSAVALARDDRDAARRDALRAVEGWRETPCFHPQVCQSLGETLLALGEAAPAEYALALARAARPADASLLRLHARAQRLAGQPGNAVHTARLAFALAPEAPESRRTLAAALESASEWEAALQERQAVVAALPNSPADHYALGACALKAGNLSLALQAAERALELAPEDGLSRVLLGDVHVVLGDEALALENYRQAVRLAPQVPETWLALAGHLRRSGELSEALETLRSAAQQAASQAEIHRALGELYLQSALPEQALSPLEEAARLVGLPLLAENGEEIPSRLNLPAPPAPLTVSVAACLGQTYAALERYALALPYLRLAYHRQSHRRQVARAYARTLRGLRKPSEARLVLEEVLASHPTETAPYLEYARAALEAGEGYAAAAQALETVLRLSPDHAEAHALLAETNVASGAHAAAWEHYQAAMRSPLMQEPHWMVRLSLGFAHLALARHEYPAAIAALQAAIQKDPDHAALRQALYQSYRLAGLHLEAEEQLEALFPQYAEAPSTLLWVAEQAARYGYERLLQRALDALEASPPEDADTLMRWSILYARREEPEQAARIVARLIASPHTPSDVLQRAGEHLLQEGYASHAIPPLESARQRAASAAPESLYAALSEAYRQSGQPQMALDVLADGLERHPAAVTLLKQSARLHMQNGKTALALDYLEAVVTHRPEDLEARHLMLEIHYQRGELAAAYRHARWLETYLGEHLSRTTTREQARLLAATLAAELLDFSTSTALLEAACGDAAPCRENVEDVPVLALKAELALQTGEEVSAARLTEQALRLAPDSPRVLALQARLLARQGIVSEGRASFEKARGLLSARASAVERRAIAQAALELDDLAAAESLLRPLAENPQRSPWGGMLYLETLVRQADESFLAADLEMAAPVPKALPQRIREVAQSLRQCFESQKLPLPAAFEGWERRARWLSGEAGMDDFIAACSDETLTPEEMASCLLAARRLPETLPVEQLAAAGRRAPDSALVWLHLSLGMERCGELDAALRAAERSLALSTSASWRWHAGAWFLRARLHYRQGAPDAAYEALRQALALREKEPAWQHLAFLAALSLEDAAGVVRHAEALRASGALSPQDACHLGRAYRQMGDPQTARRILQETVRRAPEFSEAWRLLAETEAALGAWGEAARCAERALQSRPEDTAALRLRVRAALHLVDGRAARSRALSLTKSLPSDAEAWFLLAQAWELLSRPGEALAAARKALSLHENPPPDWHLRYVNLLAAQEGAPAALESLLPLLAVFPQETRFRLLAVQFALEAGREEEALSLAQSALQDEALPLADSDRALLHMLAGRILRSSGNLDQAVYHLTEATRLTPQDAGIWMELGRAYEKRRDMHRAVQAYERACALSPENPEPYHLAGEAYKTLKDYPRAERAIRHAAALSPTNVQLQRLLASLTALNIVHG